MSSKHNELVPNPCHEAEWDDMVGDERKRLCLVCTRHVHNISEMPRAEADALLDQAATQDRLCIQYSAGHDGEVFYKDSTNPVWRLHRQVQGSKRLLAAALALPLLAVVACEDKGTDEAAQAEPVLKIDQGIKIDPSPGAATQVTPPSENPPPIEDVVGDFEEVPRKDVPKKPEHKIGKVRPVIGEWAPEEGPKIDDDVQRVKGKWVPAEEELGRIKPVVGHVQKPSDRGLHHKKGKYKPKEK